MKRDTAGELQSRRFDQNEGFNVAAHVGDASTGVVTFHRFALAVDEEFLKVPADVVVPHRTIVQPRWRSEEIARRRAAFLQFRKRMSVR